MSTVLSVSGLSKKFSRHWRRSLAYGVQDVLRELLPALGASEKLRPSEFWALDDVSFELRSGEAMAVVGRNGAGKSTLLRILSGLLKPDRGEVRIRGRTSELIELGTGFNPLLSGRENVLAGAALHGLYGRDARQLLDQVVDFAELAEFIDAPVQSYSSGMRARLGYALGAGFRPDLLLVDEVLAVGDQEFQRKCLNHMRGYVEGGGALLLVSHNPFQIQVACGRGILLDGGRLAFAGTAVETLDRMYDDSARLQASAAPRAKPRGSEVVAIEEVAADNPGGGALRSGDPMRIRVRYRTDEALDALWGFSLWTSDQWICIAGEVEQPARRLRPGLGELQCLVPRLPLLPGRYSLRTSLTDPATWVPFALFGWDEPGLPIQVRAEPDRVTNAFRHLQQLVRLDVDWN